MLVTIQNKKIVGVNLADSTIELPKEYEGTNLDSLIYENGTFSKDPNYVPPKPPPKSPFGF